MINKIMGPKIVPNIAKAAKGGKGDKMMRFMRSETLGKVLDVAAENQTLCQSLFAFAICVGPRPLTNFIVTEDKQDALYASCHSVSSGGVGFVWPLVFATPIAVGLKRIAKNPAKFLKPDVIEKFYPSVKTVEELSKDGKSLVKKVATDAEGNMLRNDGSVLCQSLEPAMIYGEKAQKAFEAAYPNHYVEKSTNVARIRPTQNPDGTWNHVKTERGVGKFKIDGSKSTPVGEAIQAKNFTVDSEGVLRYSEVDKNGQLVLGDIVKEKDLTPISEEMEIGVKKEQNVNKFINMVPDILLAPLRASLTIALIPPILKTFGIKKSDKSKGTAQTKSLNVVSQSNNSVVQGSSKMSALNSVKKGVN